MVLEQHVTFVRGRVWTASEKSGGVECRRGAQRAVEARLGRRRAVLRRGVVRRKVRRGLFVTKSSSDSRSDVSSTASGAAAATAGRYSADPPPACAGPRRPSKITDRRRSARGAPRNVQIRGRHLLYHTISSVGDSSRPTRRFEDVGRGPGPTQEAGLVAAVLGAPRRQGSTRAPTKPFASGASVAFIQVLDQKVARSQRASLDVSVENMASGASTTSATAAIEASRLASDAHGINEWARLATTFAASSLAGSSSSLVRKRRIALWQTCAPITQKLGRLRDGAGLP